MPAHWSLWGLLRLWRWGLALALVGLPWTILMARAEGGGMLAFVALRRESPVAAPPRYTEADIVLRKDWLLVRLPPGAELGKLVPGERGQSMQPGLGPGHLVVLAPLPVEQIKVGDIISFEMFPGIPNLPPPLSSATLHRVVEIGEDKEGWFAVTQGDAEWLRDPKVRATQVRGVVIMELK